VKLPRLFGSLPFRLAIAMFLLLCANLMIFLSLYLKHLRGVVAPQMAHSIGGNIVGLRVGLEIMTPEQRRLWFEQFGTGTDVSLQQISPSTVVRPPPTPFLRRLEAELRPRLGDDTRLSTETTPNAPVHVYFSAGPNRYRLSMPSIALEVGSAWPLAWLLLSTALIIWLGVLFTVWQVRRPLQRSAESLMHNANQLTEIEMPASAPQEFRVFAERFNALVHRLAAQEHERALVLAGVSHDLRAPLTRVRMRAELLEEPISAASFIRDTESMRRIVDQFLDYQRSSAPSVTRIIDAGIVVESIVLRYRDLGKAIEFRRTTSGAIKADPGALERVVDNLVDNALKHGREPVEIDVSQEGSNVLLSVRDHGIGIPPDQIERALRPFERLDTARSAQGHCGLGLSIVRRLIERIGGQFEIGNHANGGLLVVMRFPVADTQD
jgi:signal transduction histidine kinase